jgi:hypothetical protein
MHRLTGRNQAPTMGVLNVHKLIALSLLVATPALAQQYQHCTTECQGNICSSVCRTYDSTIIHRPLNNPQQQANDNAYNQRAYEFELQQLDRENRRR